MEWREIQRTLTEQRTFKKYGRTYLAPPEEIVCDFCITPGVVEWEYPAGHTVINSDYAEYSDDGWAACGPCHDLIEAERWDDLVVRSVNQQIYSYGDMSTGRVSARNIGDMFRAVRATQDGFRAARTGPAIPFDPVAGPQTAAWMPPS